MKFNYKFLFAFLFVVLKLNAQQNDSLKFDFTQIEKELKYQTGVIKLDEGNGTLTVPSGFRYLNRAQSVYVMHDLWGNPTDSSVLGLLVPENRGVMEDKSWLFEITFDNMGYVKDDDADDIDYDDLIKEMQKDVKDANPERVKEGYAPVELIGWAAVPFYDKDKKVLHWAKELKFGTDTLHTLNYNLRILGRKGVYVLNAISSMNELPEVQANIDHVIGSINFEKGSSYSDFNPDVDEVAAWTIGGLVAGKILAKAGLFAFLAKFAKLIFIGIAAAGTAIWKFITGRRNKE